MDKPSIHQRLLDGDEDAFTEVYQSLNPSLIRIALSITGNRATAEEVAQETWLTVLEKLQTFKGDAPLRHWIMRILSNKARSRGTRDAKMRSEMPPPSGSSDKFSDTGDWAVPPSLWDDLTPERILAGRQAWELVQHAILNLPPTQQAILSLLQHEKLSAGDCAEILDISPGNVRVQLHRAREDIRRILNDTPNVKKTL